MKTHLSTLLLLTFAASTATAAEPVDVLRAHVEHLASETLAGRLTGTDGERLAAEYLVEQLEAIGVVPLQGSDSLVDPFEFTAGSKDTGTSLAWSGATYSGATTVQALSFSNAGETSGNVVFAGYGITVPDSADFGYDSYATLDVEDKIVLVLRYFPEDLEGDARTTLARYSGLRYKAMTARENGAKALLVATGPKSPNGGEVVPMTFDTAVSGSGILAASVNDEVATALFAAADKSFEEAQNEFDSGNPHIAGYPLGDAELELEVQIERERRSGRNVVGVLKATGTSDSGPIMIGAHYDHLGHGRAGNSLARADETGSIHFGADDNASGTAAVVEALRQLSQYDRKRDVLVGLWSGEELGLLGSTAFVNEAQRKPASYVNLDMVGRMRDNKLTVQAVGSSPDWNGVIERANVPVGIDLNLQTDPYLPTDSAAFNQAGIPTLNFFTGSHTDYHRPTDTADDLDYDELARITRLTALVMRQMANRDEPLEFVKVERRVEEGGGRDTVRAFTGTIPDYTAEQEGLLLGGVMAGGPAEEAGLAKGDVIVEFGGSKIANIYDYTYALDAVKVDVPLKVVYVRDGEQYETTLTPRARK